MLVLLLNKTHLRILFHITLSAVRALGMRGLPISCRVLALWQTTQFSRIKTRCGIRGGPAGCGWPSEEGSLIPTRILPLKRSTPSSAQTWHCWQFKSSGCGVTRALRPSTTSPSAWQSRQSRFRTLMWNQRRCLGVVAQVRRMR